MFTKGTFSVSLFGRGRRYLVVFPDGTWQRFLLRVEMVQIAWPYLTLRVQVPNNKVLGFWVIVMIV